MQIELDAHLLNPTAYYLLKYFSDPAIRLIIQYGGSSSGKTYSTVQTILLQTLADGENTLVMRKVGASISKTVYEDFKVAVGQMGLTDRFKFKDSLRQIVCMENKAKIDFTGLDDPEKIKGISNYKRVFLDEWSEYDEEDFKQIRKRLRGKEGQQIIVAFNPISERHWIKKNVFDKEKWHDLPMDNVEINGIPIPPYLTEVKSLRINSAKEIFNPRTRQYEEHAPDTVAIQTTYLNNFWVVGSPCGTFGYYDRQCIADFEKDRLEDENYYRIYALGEWGVLRTGSEFFGSFNIGLHCSLVAYDPELPIHLSVDNNVLPYITTTFWQVSYDEGTHIRQIDELCAATPDNTVRKAAKLVSAKLKSYGCGQVFLHGDTSTKTANTIDEQNRSFLDLYIATLEGEGITVIDKVGNKNPPVAISGEFINAVFEDKIEDISIRINGECLISIDDYLSVQKDENGGMLKTRLKNKVTGQTYEEHGHASDCMRYICTDILRKEFTAFSNRRKRNLYAGAGYINYFKPVSYDYTENIVYAMPNINGKFVMVYGQKTGDKWHITDAVLKNTLSTDTIREEIGAYRAERIILECSKSYHLMARELRDSLSGDVRAIHECADMQRRIASVSDYVASNVLFNEEKEIEKVEYSAFMDNLLDYSNSRENIEASAVISGFVQAVLKLGL